MKLWRYFVAGVVAIPIVLASLLVGIGNLIASLLLLDAKIFKYTLRRMRDVWYL